MASCGWASADRGTQVPERGDAILEAVTAAGASLQPASPVDRYVLSAVHDDDLVGYLEHAWDDWVAAGYLEEPGQDRVVPYAFPIPGVSTGRIPTAMSARARTYAFDTMTLIGPGSAEAILERHRRRRHRRPAGGRRCSGRLRHLPATGPPCGPPFLRRVVLPEQRRRRRRHPQVQAPEGRRRRHRRPSRQRHPGDLLPRPDVFYGSVHVDPGHGWFPHWIGFADERGEGAGNGPTATSRWHPDREMGPGCAAVESLVDEATGWGAEALVVSLGVDAAAG